MDCPDPACNDKVEMFKRFNIPVPSKRLSGKAEKKANKRLDCPPTRGEIGEAGWKLLHTMAAYYPDKPSRDDEVQMRQFINGFAKFYPCNHCAEDFQQEIKNNPPQTESRKSLSLWMCEQHNEVNRKIGKKPVKCVFEELQARWRTGRPECWNIADDDEPLDTGDD